MNDDMWPRAVHWNFKLSTGSYCGDRFTVLLVWREKELYVKALLVFFLPSPISHFLILCIYILNTILTVNYGGICSTHVHTPTIILLLIVIFFILFVKFHYRNNEEEMYNIKCIMQCTVQKYS